MVAAVACLALSGPALSADNDISLDGSQLGLAWAILFVGILLSIALLPLLAPSFWHHHFGKVSAFWALAFIVPFAFTHASGIVASEMAHAILLDYVPLSFS